MPTQNKLWMLDTGSQIRAAWKHQGTPPTKGWGQGIYKPIHATLPTVPIKPRHCSWMYVHAELMKHGHRCQTIWGWGGLRQELAITLKLLSLLLIPVQTLSKMFNPLAPELFFLILAHPVSKMWIIQEPNKLALWNKLYFEEKKKRRV